MGITWAAKPYTNQYPFQASSVQIIHQVLLAPTPLSPAPVVTGSGEKFIIFTLNELTAVGSD